MNRGYDMTLIINNSENDYAGGTKVTGYSTTAKVSHALGTGNVLVAAGATLVVSASDVMNRGADLYLNYNATSATYAQLNLAAGTTTVAANVYVDGTGGWTSPTGYTALEKGQIYTSDNLPNYITGTGSLMILGTPTAVTDLAAGNPDWFKLDLTWTAPGAMPVGSVASYDLRYSTEEITADNFADATPVTGLPTPQDPGARRRSP